ncbi:MAG: hypothetical protein GXO17_02940 [Thermodesulfobacteria bacterium]|nr:hypothetical protein [Thermodesulfobacteriota bacterium]
MDLEDILAVVGIVVGLALLATVVLTTLDLWDLHRRGAPPEAYAERICAPVSFLARQPASLLRYLGVKPDAELTQTFNSLANRVTVLCEEAALKLVSSRLKKPSPSPTNGEKPLQKEAI